MGLTSFGLPARVFIKAKLMKPKAKPLAIEEVSGIMMMVKTPAGRP